MSGSGIRLALMDVGHGNCAVVFGGKEAIVFDAPPGSFLVKFLRSHGVALVTHLVLSHADLDHIGGVDLLIASGIDVETIWVCDDQANPSSAYERLRTAFKNARLRGNTRIRRGHPDSDQADVRWGALGMQWLGPNPEDRMALGNRNSLSVVARLTFGSRGVAIFPGDLDLPGYQRLSPETDWSCDWLVAPHHGGRVKSLGDEGALIRLLLEKTGAAYVFFSNSRRRFDLPRRDVVAAVLEGGGETSIRCSQLSKFCSQNVPVHRLEKGPISAGARWDPMECCAGTITLDLDEAFTAWAGRESHDRFVRSFQARLCAHEPP
jgi:beta-lactamase superfamily II metal-dependent hydrolase